MKRHDAGCAGSPEALGTNTDFSQFTEPWRSILPALTRGRGLRSVQRLALEDARILESRQNIVVSAPTNSGKSLIGHAVLLDAILQGRRAVLLEPLRALAQEQAEELSDLIDPLKPRVFSRTPKIRISTGDYRLDGEIPSAVPPVEGEIIVATPERLDAIFRNPEHSAWLSSVGAVVVDEAHLIGDPRRGPTLELLVASMLSMPAPPRIVLLSATIGQPELLSQWLRPCQIVTSEVRTPLTKEVWELEDDEHADEILCCALRELLNEPSSAALVFVYRRNTAEALARKLSDELGNRVLAYHSGQAIAARSRARADFLNGRCRCLIATTALAMGVNLPATHVFVRDTTFYGSGRLSASEMLQILGRAGRGDRSGLSVALVRPGEDWGASELAADLRRAVLPPLRSSFDTGPAKAHGRAAETSVDVNAASLVASCLARMPDGGVDKAGLSRLLGNTLGGGSLLCRVDASLRWLTDPSRALAYQDEEGRFRLTVLGTRGVRAMLPLAYLAGIGQLVRDLISLDPTAKLLGRWSALDHLLVASLMSDRAPSLRRFSEALAGQLDGWMESRPSEEKSLLFGKWVMGTASASKADELIGSLGLNTGPRGSARKRAYVALLAAAVLDERSRGVAMTELQRRWGLPELDGAEEAWRDTALWLLSGHTAILEVRSVYHHLRECCSATDEQVRSTKRALDAIRNQAYDLMERLKYCSALGPLMRGVRDALRGGKEPIVGVGTIRKLESNGVTTLQQVANMDVDALVTAGVQKRFAKQIRAYVRRRMR